MSFKLLLTSKNRITHPISIVRETTYGTAWLSGEDERGTEKVATIVFSSDFEELYSDVPIAGHIPLTKAPFKFDIKTMPAPGTGLSEQAYNRYVLEKKELPKSDVLFEQITSSINRFVSFAESFAPQADMSEFLACWILSTYATDCFDTVGYIWPNGEKASGKTQCLNAITALSFLGRTVTSASTFAAIRDEAILGATIGFDDCENIKGMDGNKREFLLAGNSKGAQVALKAPGKREGEWETQYVNAFSPRAFTSIGIPDPVLESRTIMISLARSNDLDRTRRSPTNNKDWEFSPSDIRDAAWLTVTKNLPTIRSAKDAVGNKVDVTGREFDIFQPALSIAYWLTQQGVDGLIDRMINLMERYRKSKVETYLQSPENVLVLALWNELTNGSKEFLRLETSAIEMAFKRLCRDLDITDESYVYIDVQRIGQMLRRMGFEKSNSNGAKRSWVIKSSFITKKAELFGIELPDEFQDNDEDFRLNLLSPPLDTSTELPF